MELRGRHSPCSVRLTPVAYQFPEGDDSWLVIEGVVTGVANEWQFREPVLTAPETSSLVAWLRSAAAGDDTRSPQGAAEPTIAFVEPCLGFTILGRSAAGITLRIILRAEAAPPSACHRLVPPDGATPMDESAADGVIDLTLSLDDMLAAATQLETEARAFPFRRSEY